MFLSLIEVFFEAFPQAILNSVYFFNRVEWQTEDWDTIIYNHMIQIISLTCSGLSIIKAIAGFTYTVTFDWNNSIIGIVNTLRKNYKKKEKFRQLDEEQNKNIISPSACEKFQATLQVSGFQDFSPANINKVQVIQNFLRERGFSTEMLIDNASYSDSGDSCTFNRLKLVECIKYMEMLENSKLTYHGILERNRYKQEKEECEKSDDEIETLISTKEKDP